MMISRYEMIHHYTQINDEQVLPIITREREREREREKLTGLREQERVYVIALTHQ